MPKTNLLERDKFINQLSDHFMEVILAVVLLLSGGFYDYSAMVLGALLFVFCQEASLKKASHMQET